MKEPSCVNLPLMTPCPEMDCTTCGWNPEVAAERKARLEATGIHVPFRVCIQRPNTYLELPRKDNPPENPAPAPAPKAEGKAKAPKSKKKGNA